ncbi:BlaR1 family beta-lactam sensor/signal transducer [Dethiothermospora halolimnae]|uniref:BlaR1 family beta-lactam sensor/signal transducer n=1 Tax=Dethiothermospora halolimnae TaxID=3114390 RepID=UPI003CCC0E7F
MKDVSIGLIYSSLMGSGLVVFILLIRRIFKGKFGARWNYYIWFLVCFRLIIPYAPQTSFSIFNVYRYFKNLITMNNRGAGINNVFKGSQQSNINTYVDKSMNLGPDYSLSIGNEQSIDYLKLFFIIWLLGTITYSIVLLVHNIRIYKEVERDKGSLDNNIIRVVENCKSKMGIEKYIEVACTTKFKTPIIFGALSPILLLPKDAIKKLNREELEYIIFHELAHYKRKDVLINWISIIIQVIHWFNPVIWYTFYKMRQDREIACDAYVLCYLKPKEYKKYGETIITMLQNISFSPSIPMITGFSSNKYHIKQRISMIASFDREINRIRPGKIIVFILLACILLTNGKGMSDAAIGEGTSESPINVQYEDLSNYFTGYDGSFVMLDKRENKYRVYNKIKSEKRVSPCSTFKIIISLIGLEYDIINDKDNKLEWNGYKYPIKPWNQDHTLLTAMKYSVNWYFERVSGDIGKKIMKDNIDIMGYGNKDISGGIREFWAQSSLKISPIEQIDILKKIYNYKVPISPENIDIVKETLKISDDGETILSGKTGSGTMNNKNVNGWFIGYVEKNNNVYFFALNIEGKDRADGASARKIALDILKDKGLY